jgi:hypothetical protein
LPLDIFFLLTGESVNSKASDTLLRFSLLSQGSILLTNSASDQHFVSVAGDMHFDDCPFVMGVLKEMPSAIGMGCISSWEDNTVELPGLVFVFGAG